MARKIVITSGKGGVGKTTVTANLGLALAMLNQKVLIIDVDLGLNNLDVAMGVETEVVYDLVDVLNEKCRVKQAIIQNINIENLFILPCSHYIGGGKIDKQKFEQVIKELSKDFDYILLDSPAGIENGFYLACTFAEEAIIVVTPNMASLRDADKVVSLLTNLDLSLISFVANRVRGDLVVSNKILSHNDIEEILHVRCVGVIPECDLLNFNNNFSNIKQKYCNYLEPFYILANNIQNTTYKIYDYKKNYKGFCGYIKRLLKKYI